MEKLLIIPAPDHQFSPIPKTNSDIVEIIQKLNQECDSISGRVIIIGCGSSQNVRETIQALKLNTCYPNFYTIDYSYPNPQNESELFWRFCIDHYFYSEDVGKLIVIQELELCKQAPQTIKQLMEYKKAAVNTSQLKIGDVISYCYYEPVVKVDQKIKP